MPFLWDDMSKGFVLSTHLVKTCYGKPFVFELLVGMPQLSSELVKNQILKQYSGKLICRKYKQTNYFTYEDQNVCFSTTKCVAHDSGSVILSF